MGSFGIIVLVVTAAMVIYYAYNIMKDLYAVKYQHRDTVEVIPVDTDRPKKVDMKQPASDIPAVPQNLPVNTEDAEEEQQPAAVSNLCVSNIDGQSLEEVLPAHHGGLYASDLARVLQDSLEREKSSVIYKFS